jgi:hypothetical protein
VCGGKVKDRWRKIIFVLQAAVKIMIAGILQEGYLST